MKPEIRDLALGIGVSAEALKKWRQRGGVPHRLRLKFLDRAAAEGIALDAADMEWPPTSEPASPPKSEAA